MKLRTRYLLLITATTVALLIAFGATQLWLSFRELRTSNNSVLQFEASMASARLQNRLSTLRVLLLESAAIPWGHDGLSGAAQVAEAERVLKLLPELLDLRLVGYSGHGILVSRLSPAKEITVRSDDNGAAGVCAAISLARDPAGRLTASISCKGAVGGLVVATLGLEFVSDLLTALKSEATSAIYVVDSGGRLVAHSDSIALHQRFAEVVPFNDSTSISATMLMHDVLPAFSQRDEVIATSTLLPDWQWRLVVERPSREALRPLLQQATTSLAIILGSAVVLTLIAAALSNSLTRPIRGLESIARRIGAGDLSARSSLRTSDELGSLGREINRMSEHLQGYTRKLEVEVQAQTQALTDAYRELEQVSQHKSDFLAHMSHELRTPLNAVIGFSEMLKAQYFGSLNDKQAEYVHDIHESGQHLLSLINDILDLAKIESGHMELLRTRVNVRSIAESCCALMSERVSRKAQSLTLVVADGVGEWSLDERKFKQCLLNLLSNASKFTADGGLIDMHIAVDAESLVVSVRDNGAGISAVDQTRLFTEFFQAGGEPGRAAREGTGLGLALTKRFVELHGGSVAVASEVGVGSEFTLRIPHGET